MIINIKKIINVTYLGNWEVTFSAFSRPRVARSGSGYFGRGGGRAGLSLAPGVLGRARARF